MKHNIIRSISIGALLLFGLGACATAPSEGIPTYDVNSDRTLAEVQALRVELEKAQEMLRIMLESSWSAPNLAVASQTTQEPIYTTPDTDATISEDLFVPVPRPSGGWYPWFAIKANMIRSEFIAALSGDHGKFRVHWEGYSKDLGKLGFPVGNSLESLQAFLASDDISVVECTPEILSKYYLGRTNKDGSVRDLNYVRKSGNCYNGEQLLFHGPSGRFVLSLGCGNVMRLRETQSPKEVLSEGISPTLSLEETSNPVEGKSQVQVSCTYTEQDGCLEIDIIAVHKNATSPELQELLTSAQVGLRKVSEVLGGDIALRIFAAAEERRIRYYAECFTVSIRFWGTPSPQIVRMSEYRMPTGRSSVGVNPSPRKANDFSQTMIELAEITTGGSYGPPIEYRLEVCQGKGALQVPWDFLPEGSVIQIEATEVATVFPFSTRQASTKKVGLWLTALQLNGWRANGTKARLEYVVIPFIFPEQRD